MANTTTYQQAKGIYFDAGLMADNILTISGTNNVRAFRKHLTEFEYRQKLGKRFTSTLLENNQLLVKRIK